MHEIEVKARIDDVDAFVERLAAAGCTLGSPITQDDTTYVRKMGTLDEYLSNHDFLRVRVQGDGTALFTTKHHVGRNKDLTSAPEEYEVTVSDAQTMRAAILSLGFVEAVRIRKTRRKGVYGAWEVCVDEVDGLGAFVELEELAESGETQAVQEKMLAFLSTLGVIGSALTTYRYDMLILEQKRAS